MKHLFKFFITVSILLCGHFNAHAVYVEKMPVIQFQPNGDTLHLFATGDEVYHRFHDADNYTIVLAPSGWWVYAMPDSVDGLRPSPYKVGEVNPAQIGLTPGLSISRNKWLERRRAWDIPEQYRIETPKTSGRNHGDFCNLVIFIRFADDTVYTRSISNIDKMFSDSSSERSVSVYNYFKHASYNKIFIRTYYAPEPDGEHILSYQSPHPRNYYMPRTAVNTIGYTNYADRSQREFELLVGAVNYINDSAPVPSDYVLDCDNDGFIDNVNFVVKGAAAGWNDLLWPHKWNLYGRDVYINGKQVSTFNFALEGSGADYFGTSTFCHEMFHSLGAPDLYRYNSPYNSHTPVGQWDLMATNSKPPQHMSAYLKYKYGNWLDSIPLITTPGTYSLHSVGDTFPDNIAYRFPSSDPDQFYVVEYRDNTKTFETQLPGRGLIIYRVDTRFNGNSNYDGEEHFDEVWVFRPNSNSADEDGNLNEAYFNPNRNRTEFTPATEYYPYLSDGTPDITFAITNITAPGNTIRFKYGNRVKPSQLNVYRVTTSTASLNWKGQFDAYRINYRPKGSNQPYLTRTVRSCQATLVNLTPNTNYEWKIVGFYSPNDTGYADSLNSTTSTFHTQICNNPNTVAVGNSSESHTSAPFVPNEKYTYSQQIFTADEINGAMDINTVSLNYTRTSLKRDNCTIYLAHTTLDHFTDTTKPLPYSQLTQVYCGSLNFIKGWNDILLDTPFPYNGTDNLILAIDDNTDTNTYVGDRFLTNSTYYQRNLTYSGTTVNPDPTSDTIKGSRSLHFHRNNVQFTGCPVNNYNVYVCVISDNSDRGRVTGEGLYPVNENISIHAYPKSGYRFLNWHDGITDNPRQIILTQDTVMVAFFATPVGIDDPDSSAGYVILSRHQSITVQGAENQPVTVYDLMGRTIAHADNRHPSNLTFSLPHTGIYIVRIGNDKPIKLFIQ